MDCCLDGAAVSVGRIVQERLLPGGGASSRRTDARPSARRHRREILGTVLDDEVARAVDRAGHARIGAGMGTATIIERLSLRARSEGVK